MTTSDGPGELSLYNKPRELIDPRDPAIGKTKLNIPTNRTAQNKFYCLYTDFVRKEK